MKTRFFFAAAVIFTIIAGVESNAQQGWKVDTVKNNVSGILTGVKFTSANAGVILGDTSLRTTDGGKHWLPLGDAIGWNGQRYGFFTVHCFDSSNWVGIGATTFRTTNAGQAWIFDSLYLMYNTSLFAVDFVDRLTGFAVGSNSIILRSSDGGAKWVSVSSLDPTPSAIIYWGIASVGGSSWIAGGGNPTTLRGVIIRSTDNGAVWDTVLHSSGRVVTALSFPNTSVGFAAADSIYRTSNGGATWKGMSPIPGSVRAMSFKDPLIGTVVCSSGKIYRTRDGGASWVQQISNTTMDLWAVCFVDTSKGWAVGYRDVVTRTTNGGWGPLVGVPEASREIPEDIRLHQNFPNPFNPSTTIRYGLPNHSHVMLTVFNALGQQVAELINGEMEAGYHEVRFDGKGLSSGVYFYRLRAGSVVQTKELLIIR